MKLLFVCLGNICRSPAAEKIMESSLKRHEIKASCDSCGTSSYHKNSSPDPRMIEHASKRSYDLTSLKSRPFEQKDFNDFDFIFTMDKSNFENINKEDLDQKYSDKIFQITNFCKEHEISEVPDPYLKDERGFELVLDILEDACEQIALKLKKSKTL